MDPAQEKALLEGLFAFLLLGVQVRRLVSAVDDAGTVAARLQTVNLVVDEDLRLLTPHALAQAAAAALGRLHPSPLRVVGGRLHPLDPSAGPLLRAAVRAVIRPDGPESGPASAVSLPCGPGEPPLFEAIAMRRLADDLHDGTCLLVLRPIGGRAPHPNLQDLLRNQRGLTPREAELAEALLPGGDLAHAAGRLSISVEHARQRLKVIFQKMEVSSRAQLTYALVKLQTGADG